MAVDQGPSTSQVPAFGLGGALIGGLILFAVAFSLRRRTRGRPDRVVWAVAAGLGGLGASLVAVFVAGMRHYGGSTSVDRGVSTTTCATWWEEVGLPSGTPAVPGDFSNTCRHDAIAATGPAVLLALLVGLAVALLLFGLQLLAGRRRVRHSGVG